MASITTWWSIFLFRAPQFHRVFPEYATNQSDGSRWRGFSGNPLISMTSPNPLLPTATKQNFPSFVQGDFSTIRSSQLMTSSGIFHLPRNSHFLWPNQLKTVRKVWAQLQAAATNRVAPLTTTSLATPSIATNLVTQRLLCKTTWNWRCRNTSSRFKHLAGPSKAGCSPSNNSFPGNGSF